MQNKIFTGTVLHPLKFRKYHITSTL